MVAPTGRRFHVEPRKFFQGVTDQLTTYVRHLAWLHAKPGKSKKTRFQQLIDEGKNSPLLDFPDLGYAKYIIEKLLELGLVQKGGMEPIPISWSELNSWQSVTGSQLTPWEAITIRQLSAEYLRTFEQAADQTMPAPYSPVNFDRTEASNRVGSMLRSLASRNNKRKGLKTKASK